MNSFLIKFIFFIKKVAKLLRNINFIFQLELCSQNEIFGIACNQA